MATHSSILPGESHGQRSLTGYSPQGHKESNMTEQLTLSLHFLGSDSDSHLSWQSTPSLGKFSCLPGVVPTPALATSMSQSPAQAHAAPSMQRTAALSDSMDPTKFFFTVPSSSTPHAARPSRE